MKRTIPLLITAIAGSAMILAFFVPALQKLGEMSAVWFDILAAIAFLLGGGNLLKLHLKKISDREPGWGYAAVTLISFIITLVVGLFKIGTSPAANTEYYGQIFAPLAATELPESSVPGEVPARADGLRLPASVFHQLRSANGRVYFRGWMNDDQFQDLIDYQDHLKWRATVEQLHAATQPPAAAGPISYLSADRSLAFTGTMTDEQRTTLTQMFEHSAAGQQAVATLYQLSLATVTIDSPIATQAPVRIAGPMAETRRTQLYAQTLEAAPIRIMSSADRQQFLTQLEQAGAPLTPRQLTQFNAVIERCWSAQELIAAINTAGAHGPVARTYTELYTEQLAGVAPLETHRPAAPDVVLNPVQHAAIRRFAGDPAFSVAALLTELRASGQFTDAMGETVSTFLASQTTIAARKHELWLKLRKSGPLSAAQQDLLLEDYRRQNGWRTAVDAAFYRSQQVKYPWSGEYAEHGSPFWWIYQYVFEPLLTTTFAMLAFYVASAAFRAFRAKNLEAILLLGTAFIILLGRTFAGYLLTAWIPDTWSALKIDQLSVYIMSIVNTGGNRAILIGIALGIASTSLKVILGIDRSYLGSSDD